MNEELKTGTFSSKTYGLDVEILSIKEFEKGIEVIARAYKDGVQVGLGDGSIDMERFRFFHPSLLVDDPNGDVIRTHIDSKTGETKTLRLREDPNQAIRDQLAHTMAVTLADSSGKGKEIIVGSVGNTTDTFNPAAGAVTPCDGTVGRIGVTESWTNVRGGTGNNVPVTNGQEYCTIAATAVLNNWSGIRRLLTGFDTSSIPDTNVISSATYSLYFNTGTNPDAFTQDFVVDRKVPAASNTFANGDYDTSGWAGVAQSNTRPTVAGLSGNSYIDFAFNATGIGNISKTGLSWFGLRVGGDFDNIEPAWSINGESQGQFRMADNASNFPQLVVVHAAAPAGGAASTNNWLLMGV